MVILQKKLNIEILYVTLELKLERKIRKKRNTICSAIPLLGIYSTEVKTGT